jgi:hypothetical protein
MFFTILIGVAVVLVTGAAVKYIGPRYSPAASVNSHEFVIGTVVASLVVVPLVTVVGFSVAKNSAMTYKEFYNGFEASATVNETECTRDGSCHYEYNCDPYQVPETRTRTVSDGKGGTRTQSYTVMVTKYHDCPYATKEFNHYVSDTLGDSHEIGGTRFADDPKEWRRGEGIPGNVGRGKPKFWVAAKARIDSKNPGGVTKVAKYDNYIAASQRDIYTKHSSDISGYVKAGLLPKPAKDIHDYYAADKFQAVGVKVDSKAFNAALARFNGALGTERRGDMHVVVVNADKVAEPDRYALAMESYWQSPDLGKNTLSKNGIVVVLGAKSGRVQWSRSFTGMPEGNEDVTQSLTNVKGTDLTPAALFGPTGVGQAAYAKTVAPAQTAPTAPVADPAAALPVPLPTPGAVATTPAPVTPAASPAVVGSIESIVLAKGGGYERVHMAKYAYLKGDIQPGTTAKVVITVISLFLALGLWIVMLAVEVVIPLPAAWSQPSQKKKRGDA